MKLMSGLRGFTVAIALVLVNLALFPGAARGAAAPVRVAYSAISGAMGPLWVAHDMGIFSRHGLEVQLLYIGGGSVVTQALLGGDVQFVRRGANAVIQASLRGANATVIYFPTTATRPKAYSILWAFNTWSSILPPSSKRASKTPCE